MAIIDLEINVQDVAQIVLLYDRLQIFRSPDEDGDPTPFSPITEIEPESAIINGTVEGPWNLNGQTLDISLDGAESIPVTFSGTNPFLPATTIAAINAVMSQFAPALASEVPTDTDKIRLSSPIVGTQSILQVSGTAATTLGLSTARVNGKGASQLLSVNTEIYRFQDFDGSGSLWYRARYVNSQTGAVSPFSDAFLGGDGSALPGSTLSVGSISLADMFGNPIVGRRIIFVATGSQIVSDGSGHNYGVLPSVDRLVVVTDGNGRASVSLVKGQRLKVFFEGTTFQREFVVPTSDFDILTVASVEPDPFSIVVVPPIPVRMS